MEDFFTSAATIFGIYVALDKPSFVRDLAPYSSPSRRYEFINGKITQPDALRQPMLDTTRTRFYPSYGSGSVRRSSNLWMKGRHKNISRR